MTATSGKYEFGERIGGGGMADVFHGVTRGAEGFQRKVAIKRIKRNISTDKGFAKLFINEARLAAKLMHPNIVQTLDFDRDETGCFYLVMELIEGVDLRELVHSGRVPVSAVVFVVSEVLRALDYAHEMVADGRSLTIVHRDISPHNIMLSWQGSVKVVDFGIAKAIEGSLVSRSGSLKGKVAYMSPEQVHGQLLDGRSDLFALGIIFHELLTGTRLFVAKTEAATLSQVLTKPIPNPRSLNDLVPADLDAVVMRLLARDRGQRFERARDALDALASCTASTSQGRSDLEQVLSERFPGQGPARVRHLSSTVEGPHQSGGMAAHQSGGMAAHQGGGMAAHQGGGMAAHQSGGMAAHQVPIGLDSATAETMAATPKAIIPAPLLPRGTVTAAPHDHSSPVSISAATAPAVSAHSDSNEGKPLRSRAPLLALTLLSLLGLGAGSFVLLSNSEPDPSVEVLAVQNQLASDAGSEGSDLKGPAGGAAQSGDGAPPSAGTSAGDADVEARAVEDAGPAAVGRPDARAAKIRARATNQKKAQLTIRVKPWASIKIDGKSYGQSPQTIALTPGRHRIVLRNLGIDREERFSLTLKAAQIKMVSRDWTVD